MTKVLFVCLGNICRSPMAEFILKDMVRKRGISEKFQIESAATSSYNAIEKEEMYGEAQNMLKKMNIPFTRHTAKQIKKQNYEQFDYILAMEQKNINSIIKITGDDKENKIFRLLDFTKTPKDIADPWYTGDFYTAYYEIAYGCEKFLEYIVGEKNEPKR